MRAPPLGPALLVALLMGGAALYVCKNAERDALRRASSAERALLPVISFSNDVAEAIDRLELIDPASDESSRVIRLAKVGSAWRLIEPINAAASRDNVRALIDDLKALRLTDRIAENSAEYQKYGLSESQAFHVRAFRGPELVTDLYFGKSSARGQLLRVAGVLGSFSIGRTGPGSYSGFLYTRPLATWRDRTILAFDEADAVDVQVDNRFASFRFERKYGTWSGSFRRRTLHGRLEPAQQAWPRFDASKVAELVRAFHALSADEFGTEQERADSGLDRAPEAGGVLTITLKQRQKWVIRIGKRASGPSSWAIKDSRWASKDEGDGTLYALASWVTDWVTSDASRFEK